MFEKIVLATDLSNDWDQIIACAAEFKALGCTHAILTHVIVTKGLVGADTVAQTESQPRLEAQRKQLEAHGLDVIVETPLGLPAFSLNDVAQRHCASLIVVGSHGKSTWWEAVLGSVSNALLHHARFPILLINVKRLREEEPGARCQLHTRELLRHVLFPTDFSTVASQAVPLLKYLVPRGLSEVTLLHALEVLDAYPPAVLAPAEAAARSFIEALVQRLKAAGVPRVHSHIAKGHPIPMILDALKAGDFSLVVMGTQGRSLLAEILLGSVAYNIARLAPCPVLLMSKEAVSGFE
jgi:nucleotide-binding universal stress UspA family protein